MHRALGIQEILLNIISYCHSPGSQARCLSDLASLARTCRLFKDPALDELWKVLNDLSPLARCLPEACQPLPPRNSLYSLARQPTLREWDILRGYTRRIRSLGIHFASDCLDHNCLQILYNTDEPLFPNLRYLSCGFEEYDDESIHFLHLPFPSLVSLDLQFLQVAEIQDYLESFSRLSPNLSRLSIDFHDLGAALNGYDIICQWRNIQTLESPSASLDAEVLAQLSRMPALTRLAFKLDVNSISNPPLFFSYVRDMELHSDLWELVSLFLCQVRLPVVTSLTARIFCGPSKRDPASFFASLRTSCFSNTIQTLRLDEPLGYYDCDPNSPGPLTHLGLDDLWPCMAFTKIRCIELDVSWNVVLTESDLLALTSAWPCLEVLSINPTWGWKTLGGITPNGLLQLLQTCRSLSNISVAVNARGYTKFSPPPESAGLKLTHPLHINVINSAIEEDAVPAISAFFANIVASSSSRVSFSACSEGKLWYDAWAWVQDVR